MKTIQQAVGSIINKTPFIEEALYDKLINVSALARVIQPEVEQMLRKEVKSGAIMMAINRISPSNVLRVRKNIRKMALSSGDFIVRSDLSDYTFKNSSNLIERITLFLKEIDRQNDVFFTVSQGVFETNIVASSSLNSQIETIFKNEERLWFMSELASVTIKLPKTNMEQSGIYYFILKQLAWANISVQEVISSTHEMTIVVKEADINTTFSILMDMKLR